MKHVTAQFVALWKLVVEKNAHSSSLGYFPAARGLGHGESSRYDHVNVMDLKAEELIDCFYLMK